MNLYSQISSYSFLIKGFDKVLESDGAPGSDGVSLISFDENLEENINRLRAELVNFKYKPKPLLMFERLKNDGTKRRLMIPAVRDRVVQSSAYIVLNPIIDAQLEKESFAYRQGLSREAAARKINMLYDEGYTWIVDADIRKYFDNINHDMLLKRFEEIIPEKDVIDLINSWVKAEYFFNNNKVKIQSGVPQGSVISPMLANLYLDKFDEEIIKQGYQLVRYADDFIILTKSKGEAERALEITRDLLTTLKLELNKEKTVIKSFDEGFKYLGYIFLRSLITPASPKDTALPLGKASSYIENEVINKIRQKHKSIKGQPEAKTDEELTESKISSTEIGAAFLEALSKKGITLKQFLEQSAVAVNQNTAALMPNEEVAKALLSEEEFEEEESVEEVKEITPPEAKPNLTVLKHTLYIQEQGSILKKEGNRFVVIKSGSLTGGGDKELSEIPAIKVREVIIFGSCTLSPSVIQYCLKARIPVTLLSSRGRYYGRIESTDQPNGEYAKLQILRTMDEKFSLDFAKKIVAAKINNCRVHLQRRIKRKANDRLTETVEKLKTIINRLEISQTIDEVRGYEGNAAAVYFSTFGNLFDQSTGFYKEKFIREKRPPKDPINSLLSFGYTMLNSCIISFLFARGLNPYIGFVHSLKSGHPALASDIIEEFRNLIDSMVVQIINKKILTQKDFYYAKEPDTPCFLTNEARKSFINQFEIKMHQRTTHATTGFKVDYLRYIDLQVQQFLQVIKGEKEFYEPFTLKF